MLLRGVWHSGTRCVTSGVLYHIVDELTSLDHTGCFATRVILWWAHQLDVIQSTISNYYCNNVYILRVISILFSPFTYFFPISYRSITKLNVSYNQIEDLSGIKSLAGPSYSLTHLDLHGNKLGSMAHVSQCLCRLNNLKHLTLSLDGSGNPLCHKPGL